MSLDVIKRRPLGAVGSPVSEEAFRIGILGGGEEAVTCRVYQCTNKEVGC